MNVIHRHLPPAQPLDIAMRSLYDIARFCSSGARIGMTAPDVATHAGIMARRATASVESLELQACASNNQPERIDTVNADIIAMQDIATELQARGMSDLAHKVTSLAVSLDRSLTLVRDFAISECIGVCIQASNSFGQAQYHSSFFEGRVLQAKLCAKELHGLLEDQPQ